MPRLQQTHRYSFELFSAQNIINFDQLADNIKKVRIKKLYFRVLHENQRVALLSINNSGFNKHIHTNGLQNTNYTLSLYTSGVANECVYYVNDSENYDVVYEYSIPVPLLNIELYIYDTNTHQMVLNGDISQSNPLFAEVELLE